MKEIFESGKKKIDIVKNEEQQFTKDYLLDYYVDLKNKANFDIENHILENIINKIESNDNFDQKELIELEKEYPLLSDFFKSQKGQQLIVKYLEWCLREKKYFFNNFKQTVEHFNLSESLVAEIINKDVVKCLKDGRYGEVEEIIKNECLPYEVVELLLAKKYEEVLSGDIQAADIFLQKFKISEEIKTEFFVNGLEIYLLSNKIEFIDCIDENFSPVYKDCFKLPKIQKAALSCCEGFLNKGEFYNFNKTKNFFSISDQLLTTLNLKESFKNGARLAVENGKNIDDIKELRQELLLPIDIFNSQELKMVVKSGLLTSLIKFDINRALKIISSFKLSTDDYNNVLDSIQLTLVDIVKNGFKNSYIYESIKVMKSDFFLEGTKEIVLKDDDLKKNILKHYKNGLIWSNKQYCDALSENFSCHNRDIITIQNRYNKINNIVGSDIINNDIKLYTDIENLLDGTIVDDFSEIGITKSGEPGLIQLQEKLRNFKQEVLRPDLDIASIQNIKLKKQYLRRYARFEASQWGSHDNQGFENVLKKYQLNHEAGNIRPMEEYYQPSEDIFVKETDEEKQVNFQYSQDCLVRYDKFKIDLEKALVFLSDSKPFSHIIEKIESKKQLAIVALEKKLELAENPKAKLGIEIKIKQLQNLSLRSLADFEENLQILAKAKVFNEELRQVVFALTLKNHPSQLEKAQEVISSNQQPSFEEMNWLVDLIDHVGQEETLTKYFNDKKTKLALDEALSVKMFNQELSQAQNQDSTKTTKLNFTPTRGVLMELSGHIADACWASKYDSIAASFPNFTSVVITQNKDTKFERLSGACMLIETNSVENEELLVIRGLNPIENLINKISVADFYNKFTEYGKTIAKKSNKKLAIVIDDHSGGSASNRPVLFNYLSQLKLVKVPLIDDNSSDFNGYDITNNCYLVE